MSEQAPEIVVQAGAAYDAMRAICHLQGVYPAPVAYEVLGHLKNAGGSMLAQSLKQLGQGLELSLAEFTVTDDDGADPAKSVTTANAHLLKAAALAQQLGEELELAQKAISRQGYKE